MAHKPWPRLTETLTGPRHPQCCQSCGQQSLDRAAITGWLEHDDNDRPECRVVMLCRPCADRLIDPHPRLYRALHPHEPMIGVMDLCLDCAFRDGTACKCPQAKTNGGPGLNVIFPKPDSAHVCRSPRSQSGWIHLWKGPPTDCDGRQVVH